MSDRREMRQWKPFEELEWWGFISDKSRGNQSVSHTRGKPLYGLAIVTIPFHGMVGIRAYESSTTSRRG